MSIEGSELSGLGSVPTAAGSDSPGQTPATVNKIIAGAGISVSPADGTGDVTVTNTAPAVVTKIIAGAGIDVSPAGGTGDVTVSASTPATTAEPVIAYRSALIDLTVIADNIPLNIPQRPGFIYIVKQATLHIHDGAGTATTNLTVSIGNNANHDNEVSSFLAPASLNPLIGRVPAYAAIGVSAAQLIDSNTLIVAKVSTVAAGVTSLHGYFAVTGLWVPS